MNVSDYKAAGYALSQLIDQAVVTRAENEVCTAYIAPILGHTPTQEEMSAEPVKTAVMALSFLLVQQRSATATRAGAKTKLSEQSMSPSYDDLLRQNAPTCANALQAIDASKEPYKVCKDICRIFFTTNYFYAN